MASLAEVRYKCRRGMLELDVSLRRFVDAQGDSLTQQELDAFAILLEEPDPILYAYLFANLPVEDDVQRGLIERIQG